MDQRSPILQCLLIDIALLWLLIFLPAMYYFYLRLNISMHRIFIDVIIYSNVGINSEKAMAPHSSTLAWKIPWAAEPDRLQSLASLRVGHD